MAVSTNRITFWFGCNMLRHAEMIRLSMLLLERAGYDVEAAGGPGYCCGTAHDPTGISGKNHPKTHPASIIASMKGPVPTVSKFAFEFVALNATITPLSASFRIVPVASA